MKKIAIIGLLYLLVFLVGCNDTSAYHSQNITSSSHTTTTSLTSPYVEMQPGEIDKLLKFVSLFQTKFQKTQQLSVRTTTKTIVHGPYASVENESKSNLDLDLNDFYLLSTSYPQGDSSPNYSMNYLFEKDGQIHRFSHDSEYRITRSVVLNPITQTGIMELLGQYGLTTGATYDYLGEVIQTSNYVFEAKIGLPYWHLILGADNVNILYKLTNVRLYDQYIYVQFRFNPDFTSYVQQYKLDIQGKLNNQYYRLELDISMGQKNTPIEKKSVAEMGFRIPVSTTPENIEFDSPLWGRFDIIKNQDNWIRMYLKHGYYRMNDSKLKEVLVYDDDFQLIPYINDRLYLTKEGYYYVNLLADKTEEVYFHMFDLQYTDVVMKRIGETKTGTIMGYSESMYDVNVYTFSSSFKIYLLSVLIDWYATPIHRFDMWLKNGLETCSSPNHQPCLYFLTPHQEVSLSVYTKTPGDFVLHYHLIEAVPTPQSLDEIHDISFYSENKPFYVGWGVERGLFKFSVTEKDSFSIDIRRYIRNVDWSYRIYDLEGNIIKPTGANVYDLDIGTYVVEVTSVANTIYVPTITARPRP